MDTKINMDTPNNTTKDQAMTEIKIADPSPQNAVTQNVKLACCEVIENCFIFILVSETDTGMITSNQEDFINNSLKLGS